jgi:putative membrane protein (TIGR04086 family)
MSKNDEKRHFGRGFTMSVLFGTAVGFLVVLILFAIFAAVVASGKITEDMMRFVAVFAAFAGGLIGAVAAVKRHRARIMTVGLTVGAAMFFVTFIGSIFSDGGFGGKLTPSFLAALVAGGIIGGLVNLKRKKHKHA